MPVYTIGHSNHTPDRLFDIAAPYSITHIIDIRSVPYSGRFPQFNRDNLEQLCKERGISYEWWGDSLGGKRESGIGLDEIAELENFKRAIERLAEMGEMHTLALLCAEWDPVNCHRSMLIGPAMRKLPDGGVDLHHILRDGTLILQSELEENQSAPKSDRAGTPSLFDNF
jgi:uncharacterized protein (DUF488 family)